MDNKITAYIKKWTPLLERIQSDESLKERCRDYNAYIPSPEHDSLLEELDFYNFLKEAYDSGVVVSFYNAFTDGKEEMVRNPTSEFIKGLSENDILCCIAYHFRRDHFSEGSLINESFVDGSLLMYFRALV